MYYLGQPNYEEYSGGNMHKFGFAHHIPTEERKACYRTIRALLKKAAYM